MWSLSKNNWLHFILCLCLVSAKDLSAQKQCRLQFEHPDSKDLVLNKAITSVLQDSKGYMWFGSAQGLIKYNGQTFKIFRKDHFNKQSLPFNYVQCLCEDTYSNIWVGTDFGIARINEVTDKIDTWLISQTAGDTSVSNFIQDIHCDKNGNVWIASRASYLCCYNQKENRFSIPEFNNGIHGKIKVSGVLMNSVVNAPDKNGIYCTTDHGICFIDLNTKTVFNFRNNPKQLKLYKDDVTQALCFNIDGSLWFTGNHSKSVCRYDFKRNETTYTKLINGDTAGSKPLMTKSLYADGYGNIWLCGWQVIKPAVCIYGNNYFSELINDFSNPHGVNCHLIYEAIQDKEGTVWLGTDEGIRTYNPLLQQYTVHRPFENLKNVNDANITAMIEDGDGNLWLTGFQKDLICYHPSTQQSEDYYQINNHKPDDDHFYCLSEVDKKTLWIGTAKGVLVFNRNTHQFKKLSNFNGDYKTCDVAIETILTDSKKNKWIGTYNNGLFKIDAAGAITNYVNQANDVNSIPKNNIATLLEAKDGTVWIGCNNDGGLCRYNEQKDNFTAIHERAGDSTALQFGTIMGMMQDSCGYLWLSQYGAGLSRMDLQTGKFKTWFDNDGLPDNYVYGVMEDASHNLWIGTRSGIAVMNRNKNSIKPFEVNYGGDNVFADTWLKSKSGNIYFSNGDALIEINPQEIRINLSKISVVINDFKVFDKIHPIANQQQLNLSYQENFFSFDFGALTYYKSNKVQYAYKLEGFDKDWIYSGYRHYASYTNVPGGDYVFKVKACNSDGIWNNNALQLPVFISSPFYKTGWFYLMCTFSLIIFSIITVKQYTLYKLRKQRQLFEKQQAVIQERMRISRDIHDEIGSGLTKISMISDRLIENAKTDESKTGIEKISQSSRELSENMSELIWALNPKNDHLDSLIAYSRRHAMEFFEDTSIHFTFDGPDEIPEINFSSEHRRNVYLVIKEALNNTLKHSHASHASLKFEIENKILFIKITDDGYRIELQHPSLQTIGRQGGNGLINMQSRIESIGGKFKIEIHNGTNIFIEVPLV